MGIRNYARTETAPQALASYATKVSHNIQRTALYVLGLCILKEVSFWHSRNLTSKEMQRIPRIFVI